MDRDKLFPWLKQWYPVAAAIASSLLSFAAFLVGMGFKAQALAWITVLALLGTIVLSGLVIYLGYRYSTSSRPEEFETLRSEDEYDMVSLCEGKVIYRRIIDFRINKTMPEFVTFIPSVKPGVLGNCRAYKAGECETEYDVQKRMSNGMQMLFVHFGETLNKGEIVKGLCLEWELTDSFRDVDEGVYTNTAPGQKYCLIRVILPKDRPPTKRSCKWYVYVGQNSMPQDMGDLQIEDQSDGRHRLSHEFAPASTSALSLTCCLAWRWPSGASTEQGKNLRP